MYGAVVSPVRIYSLFMGCRDCQQLRQGHPSVWATIGSDSLLLEVCIQRLTMSAFYVGSTTN